MDRQPLISLQTEVQAAGPAPEKASPGGQFTSEQGAAASEDVLRALALGEPLEDILKLAAGRIRSAIPGSICSVLLVSDDGESFLAGWLDELPEAYNSEVLRLKIGDGIGGCGTAAYRRETVISSDVATDPNWANHHELASRHGLAACWSEPILSTRGAVLGTFAIYFRSPRSPETGELALLKSASYAAGLAIERLKNEQRSHESDIHFEMAMTIAGMFGWETDLRAGTIKWSQNTAQILGCSPEELSNDSDDALFFVDEDDRARVWDDYVRAAARQDDRYIVEFKGVPDSDGPTFWEAHGLIVREHGQAVKVIGVTQNITERKRAEITSQRWQNLFQRADFGLAFVDARSGTFIEANPSYAKQHGYSADELKGKPIQMMFPPEDLERIDRELRRIDQEGYGSVELFEIRRDGTRFPAIGEVTVIKDSHGEPITRIVYVLDISERKRAEENLRLSEERFRGIFGQTVVGIAQTDLQMRFIMVNDRYCEITGFNREELLEISLTDLTHPEDTFFAVRSFDDMLLTGKPFQQVKRYLKKDGTVAWIDNSISLVRGPDGQPASCVSVVIDITNRINAERERHLWADAFENCAHGIAIIEPVDDRITACNPAFLQMMRCSMDELRGQPLQSIYSHEYRGYVQKCLTEADQAGQVRYEARIRRREGKSFPAQMDIVSVRGDDGALNYRVNTMQDVTWRKQIEDDILEKNELLEQTYDAIFIWSPDDGVILWNKNATRLYGFTSEEAIGVDPYDLLGTVHPDPSADFRSELTTKKRWEGELIHTAKNGSEIIVESRLSVLRQYKGKTIVMETCRDITDRKRMEVELARITQLRLLGEVAMGIAHEIKNPLAGIKGVMDILIQRRGPENPERQVMEDVCREIERIDFTVRELLNHAQVRPITFEMASLIETVHRAVRFAHHQSFARKAGRPPISVDLLDDPLIVPHDTSRIEDALMNLILNAQQAISVGTGMIEVRVFTDCGEAVIEVSDNGCGIPEDNLRRIFTPFFTTRDDGTGLGLPAVQRVVRAHGGTCEVSSKVGEGSLFRLRLPIEARIH